MANNESNQEKAQELLKLYNEAEEKLFRGGKDYQQIGDHEFENLEYQIGQCGYELDQPKIGLSTLKPIKKNITSLDELKSFIENVPNGTKVDVLAQDLEAGNFETASFELPDGAIQDVVYSGPVAEGYVSPFEYGAIDPD